MGFKVCLINVKICDGSSIYYYIMIKIVIWVIFFYIKVLYSYIKYMLNIYIFCNKCYWMI